MTITAFKMTLKDGSTATYFKVPYRDENGQRRSKSFKVRKEAKEFDGSIVEIIRQKKMAMAAGVDPSVAVAQKVLDGRMNGNVVERITTAIAPATMTIESAITMFIKACETGRENHKQVKPQTAQAYKEKLNLLRSEYGTVQVGRFDRAKAKEYRDKLIETRSSRAQAKNCMVVAKMMFQWLIDDREEIKANPFDSLRIVTGDDNEIVKAVDVDDIYTDKEIGLLMEKAVEAAKANAWTAERCRDLGVLTLMAYCGLRIGEALAVEWNDVDLNDKLVRVKQTVTKTMTINETKTKHGMRRVAIHPKALGYLKIAKAHATGFYVSSVNAEEGGGGPMNYRNMKRSLDRLIKAAEIKQRGPHSLRHYFASKLIEAGYDGMALRQQMGHADLSFTVKVYGHLLNKHTRLTKDVDRMAAVEF